MRSGDFLTYVVFVGAVIMVSHEAFGYLLPGNSINFTTTQILALSAVSSFIYDPESYKHLPYLPAQFF